ncbi:MAG: enoyl-CoA hydratase [Bacillota bacterium]|nr:enoyl-CoA hydratase [Bacillota bacterium]
MDNKSVIWKKEAGICTITMNAPKSLNAISTDLVAGLEEAFEDCFDENVRAVILTGAGKSFCSGGDLVGMMEDGPSQWLLQTPKKLAVVVSCIRELPKPVIASVNGPAFGVGMSIAMACDLRIASEKAIFAQSYSSVGLSPDGAWTMTVPRILGVAKALELVMLDKPIKADESLSLGLVSKVVSVEQLEEETMKIAEKLANGPTRAYASAKALINNTMLQGIETQMDKERRSIATCGGTEDFAEGCDAVFNKRKPNFKGK